MLSQLLFMGLVGRRRELSNFRAELNIFDETAIETRR
jgi:hypothetical protein